MSAFLPNGSYIDIAKVEGGANYKAYMLGSTEELNNIGSASYCPFSKRICQHWPFRSVQSQNSLAPILKALVAAAGSTLEAPITSVAVSAYDVGSINHKFAKDLVHAALNEFHVDGHGRLDHVVRQLAPALGIQGNCSEPYILPAYPVFSLEAAQNLFTVEYTRDSMTAGLWLEECGVMEMTTHLNSAQLGRNAMQICKEAAGNKTTCEEDFKSALRSVTQNASRDKHDAIGPVLVFGECADDDAMLVALREILSERVSNGNSVDLSRVRDFSPDPTFAGSQAMAKAVWEAHGSEYKESHKQEL